MKRWVATVGTCLICGTASAAFLSGNDLHRLLQGSNMQQAQANSFVIGVYDTIRVAHDADARAKRDKMLCVSERSGIVSGQVIDVVRKYLRDNPENRNESAASLVWVALNQAWPCNQ